MMIILFLFLYCIVVLTLCFVVEPYLRLRKNILICKDEDDRKMLRCIGSVFWPITLVLYPLIRWIIIPIMILLAEFNDKVEKFWALKPFQKEERSLRDNLSYRDSGQK